jgi:phospho-N-acetylmuramoyl-pentapeptide-transferase
MNANLLIFIKILATLAVSALISLILTKMIIYYQKKKMVGQVERDFAIKENIKKQGTPNLGGIAIVISTVISFTIFNLDQLRYPLIKGIIFCYLGFFIIGLIDDISKIKFRSYKGVSALIRILLETAVALWAVNIMGYAIPYNWTIDMVFVNSPLYLGLVFILLFVFIVVGSANSANLCDGLDGLAGGVVMMCSLPVIVFLLKKNEITIASLLLAQVGSILGFIRYNFNPAKIFMGDGGALAIGVLLGIASLATNSVVIFAFASFILILETLSDIIQVTSYKLFKKRVFLMAPFHHSLQKRGWSELRVVMFFWLIGFIVSFITTIMGVIL